MPTPRSASHATPRPSSRPASKARNDLLAQLKDDHQRVKKAYSKYRRLDAEEDADTRQALVRQVLDELGLHALLEEELLYPAARERLDDASQIDEAEVEHEMLHLLIAQLRELDTGDERHAQERHARFTVLCEYTLHHVKEEEREMFPQLMKARLDWPALAQDFEERRAALKGAPLDDGAADDRASTADGPDPDPEPDPSEDEDEDKEEGVTAEAEGDGSDDSPTPAGETARPPRKASAPQRRRAR